MNSIQDESIDPQEPTAESADAQDDLRSDDVVDNDSSPETDAAETLEVEVIITINFVRIATCLII